MEGDITREKGTYLIKPYLEETFRALPPLLRMNRTISLEQMNTGTCCWTAVQSHWEKIYIHTHTHTHTHLSFLLCDISQTSFCFPVIKEQVCFHLRMVNLPLAYLITILLITQAFWQQIGWPCMGSALLSLCLHLWIKAFPSEVL
jgi:hypothetical protein